MIVPDVPGHDELAYQLWTSWTDGVIIKWSGKRLISFKLLLSLTGSSCLRNVKDVFSHAFEDPAKT